MYVSMQVIGNALSGNRGWNDHNGRAATYQLSNVLSNIYFRDWKPDMSVCPGSGGLLLSTRIDEYTSELPDGEGSLMLCFDAEATLLTAQFDAVNARDGSQVTSGAVTGPTPAAIGAEIQRLIPEKTYFQLGKAANYSVTALASGVYRSCKITSLKSGKALDIQGGATQDGAKLVQWTYSGADSQKWRLVPVSPESYIIVSVKSSKTLDVPGHSMNNGTQIEQYTYNGGPNQHWRLVEIGNNDYKIESVESGKVLDVLNASMDDGAPVQQYGYGQALNQRWRIDGL